MSIKDDFKNLNKKTIPWELVERKGYGYEIDNPIRVKSVIGEYKLIEQLAPENKGDSAFALKDYCKEETCFSEKLQSTVDHMEILLEEYENGEYVYKIYDLYFCAYKDNNVPYSMVEQAMSVAGEDVRSIILPEGFRFRYEIVRKLN